MGGSRGRRRRASLFRLVGSRAGYGPPALLPLGRDWLPTGSRPLAAGPGLSHGPDPRGGALPASVPLVRRSCPRPAHARSRLSKTGELQPHMEIGLVVGGHQRGRCGCRRRAVRPATGAHRASRSRARRDRAARKLLRKTNPSKSAGPVVDGEGGCRQGAGIWTCRYGPAAAGSGKRLVVSCGGFSCGLARPVVGGRRARRCLGGLPPAVRRRLEAPRVAQGGRLQALASRLSFVVFGRWPGTCGSRDGEPT
jgi:hypothetical protein